MDYFCKFAIGVLSSSPKLGRSPFSIKNDGNNFDDQQFLVFLFNKKNYTKTENGKK